MKVFALGLNHRTAPLDVREQVAVTLDQLPEATTVLQGHLGQGLILSTCNRTEVYTLVDGHGSPVDEMGQLFADLFDAPWDEVRPYVYALDHREAVHHLFRVSAGLDSMIIGESQILGQVRDAYSTTIAAGTASGPFSKLFHEALRIGKRARRDTGIGQNALSVSYAAVGLARSVLGDLSGRSVLVVGLGEAGKLVAQALGNSGVGSITVTNRTYERAHNLAADLAGQALPFEDLEEALLDADIVISCTGAPGYILDHETLERATGKRTNGPLCIIDIAVPRDVDPAAADLQGLRLYDIEDLDGVSEANREERLREAEKVEVLVEDAVDSFVEWWDGLSSLATIGALGQKAETLRVQEVAKALQQLSGLTPAQQRRVEAMSRSLVKKLLHDPFEVLRSKENPADLASVHRLFRLDNQDGSGSL